MGVSEWLPWLLGPGVLGLGYKLHLDAVKAERGRADDARARAEAAEKRADLHAEQIRILLGGQLQRPALPPPPEETQRRPRRQR